MQLQPVILVNIHQVDKSILNCNYIDQMSDSQNEMDPSPPPPFNIKAFGINFSKRAQKQNCLVVVNAPYLTWRSQLVQQCQPGVQLHQDGQGH